MLPVNPTNRQPNTDPSDTAYWTARKRSKVNDMQKEIDRLQHACMQLNAMPVEDYARECIAAGH